MTRTMWAAFSAYASKDYRRLLYANGLLATLRRASVTRVKRGRGLRLSEWSDSAIKR